MQAESLQFLLQRKELNKSRVLQVIFLVGKADLSGGDGPASGQGKLHKNMICQVLFDEVADDGGDANAKLREGDEQIHI